MNVELLNCSEKLAALWAGRLQPGLGMPAAFQLGDMNVPAERPRLWHPVQEMTSAKGFWRPSFIRCSAQGHSLPPWAHSGYRASFVLLPGLEMGGLRLNLMLNTEATRSGSSCLIPDSFPHFGFIGLLGIFSRWGFFFLHFKMNGSLQSQHNLLEYFINS